MPSRACSSALSDSRARGLLRFPRRVPPSTRDTDSLHALDTSRRPPMIGRVARPENATGPPHPTRTYQRLADGFPRPATRGSRVIACASARDHQDLTRRLHSATRLVDCRQTAPGATRGETKGPVRGLSPGAVPLTPSGTSSQGYKAREIWSRLGRYEWRHEDTGTLE